MEAAVTFLKRAKKSIASITPRDVPYLLFLMVFTNIFFWSLQQTMVFSFLPKWIKFISVNEVEVGKYAGIVASAIYIGTCLTSVMWGYLSDRLNKKVGVVMSGVGCLVATLVFGFSTSVTWATIGRGLQGVASGQVDVLKAFLGELYSGEMLAYGFAVMLSAWGLGNTIGPSIGGWTAFPADTYPDIFSKEGLFGHFPALLPNIIVAAGLAVGILFTFIFFPKNPEKKMDITAGIMDTQTYTGYGSTEQDYTKDIDEDSGTQQTSSLTERIKSSALVRVLCSRDCSLCSLLYLLTSLLDTSFEEIFPVFASTQPSYKGLGFTPSEVGNVLMITFVCCIVFQLTLMPKLNNYLGAKIYLIYSTHVLVLVIPMLPLIAPIRNSTLKWVALIVILFIIRSSAFAENLAINVLINNSVEPELLGSANGVTYVAANIGRLIGPLLCGSLYSWSLRNIRGVKGNLNALGFPLNQFFTFFVLSGIFILVAVIGATLDARLDQRTSISNSITTQNYRQYHSSTHSQGESSSGETRVI